jgi:hypothetical protein
VGGGRGVSAVNPALDPAKVHVLAVGIERYGAGEHLPGAASDAMRFARWAVGHGVPPANVTVACSWHGATEDPPPGARQVAPEASGLQDALRHLADVPGELLLVFWCGHGMVDPTRERVLFTADAEDGMLRNFAVNDILRFLASQRMTGLARQVVVVDACADFIDPYTFGGAAVATALPASPRRQVEQFVLFASQHGRKAAFDRIARHGALSDLVLTWLERQPVFPPDVTRLDQHVREGFDHPASQQTPVTLWHRSFRGDEDSTVHAGPGTILSTAQARRVALAVAEVVPGCAVDELTAHIAAYGAEEHLAALDRRCSTDAARLGVHKARLCWQRQRWIRRLPDLLGAAAGEGIRAAYYRAVPTGDNRDAPLTVDDALDRAAGYGRRGRPDAPLYRLVTCLEHVTGRRVDDAWFELDAGALDRLRAAAAVEPDPIGRRFVIDLRNPDTVTGEFGWPTRIVGHLYLPGQGWQRSPEQPAEPSAAGARAAVGELLQWAFDRGVATFTLGLIAPRAAFDALPEAWEYADALTGPVALWQDRPTVLHSAERLTNRQARSRWRERVDTIRADLGRRLPDVAWLDDEHRDSPALIRGHVLQGGADCYGLGFQPPELRGPLHGDPLIAAIAAGAPYVVWPGTEPATRELVARLARQGPFADLPDRLHRRRADGDEACRGLRMIWDEPDFLPQGQFTGLSTEGADDA